MKFFLLAGLFVYTNVVFSREGFVVEGVLFEKGTRIPLQDVNLFFLERSKEGTEISRLRAQTEIGGKFRFVSDSILNPESSYVILVNWSGYKRWERVYTAENFNENNLDLKSIFLEKESYLNFETTITGQKDRRDRSKKSLSVAEVLNTPGTGGDPVKAVQNLPGVNRVQSFSSQVVIQGSAPEDTAYGADGHRIPLVFHFGGLSSVIIPEALEEVEYLSAGYGSEYSDAMGGIINLKTRKPELEKRNQKGFFFVDTFKSGGLFEKKIDDSSSFLVSGRISYIGFVLKQVFKDNKDFNLTVVPEFADFTAIYNKQLSKDEHIKVLGLASRDKLGFLLTEPFKEDPALRGSIDNETTFWRLIPQWEKKVSEARSLRFSLGYGEDKIRVDAGGIFFRLYSRPLTVRGEWEQSWSEPFKTYLGFDNSYTKARVDVRAPIRRGEGGVNDPVSSSPLAETSVLARAVNLGFYLRPEYLWRSYKFTPGFRFDRFSQTKQNLLSPRWAIEKNFSPSLLLKWAGGLYYQAPEPQETDETFGNPRLEAPRAWHQMLGLEWDGRGGSTDGYKFSASLFDRCYEKLVIESAEFVDRGEGVVPERYNNFGSGRSYGLETQLQKKFEDLTWTVSGTWSKSSRSFPSFGTVPFEYDQTWNLNLIASKDLPKNWRISGRYRYVTGNPFTPVETSSFDADNDVYIPKRGPIYSERLGAFTQLDLRVDKVFVMDREIWTLYLEIQNALNAKNTEQLRYSYDYTSQEKITGLPVLPSFGLKGEF